MFAGREGHRHQFIVVGYIKPDRRRTERNLKMATKEEEGAGEEGWGEGDHAHDYETEEMTKKKEKKEIRAR
jgi:hypothetical protein